MVVGAMIFAAHVVENDGKQSDVKIQLQNVLDALHRHPLTSSIVGRPLELMTRFMPIEYAVFGICFFTLALTILLPYLFQFVFASRSTSVDDFEQTIWNARLDAESRRPNAYPPGCAVATTKGVGKVQKFDTSRLTYTIKLDDSSDIIEIPAQQVAATRVTDLFIYPIKSCAGIRLKSSEVLSINMLEKPTHVYLERGLQYDRQWLIIDSKNSFVTQRKHPKMSLIQPHIDVDNMNSITLAADGRETLVVPVLTKGVERNVRVWKDNIEAIDQGDSAAKWVSEFLDIPGCRLVYFKETYRRQCDPEFAPDHETGFADGFPILIAASTSLDPLQTELKRPIEIERFRPNIVVSGCPAWADDSWSNFEIGKLRFRNVKPCSRCSMPSVDPTKGEKDDPSLSNIQDALKHQRNGKDLGFLKEREYEVFFGSNVVCDIRGTLRVGDELKILTLL